MDQNSRSYEIERVLGSGGFGTVYAACMRGANGFTKPVALKVLNPDVSGSVEMLQRLRDEARILGLLKHRAIVHVEGLVQIDDRWVIVMELVEGASLAEILQHGTVPVSCALEIGEEVASALDVAYAKPAGSGEILQLLHRDIKPSNIQITATGEVKLLDFGVARAEFGGREAQTRSVILGSLAYLAPERLDALDTHAGDVYALGATLYELLMGDLIGRTSANPDKHRDLLNQRRQAALRASIDPAVVELIFQCLNYDKGSRPTAGELARELRLLRHTHRDPWLRDWAESTIPLVKRGRSPQTDGWSGSTVHESSGTEKDVTETFALYPEDLATGEAETEIRVAPVRRRWPRLLALMVVLVGMTMALGAMVGIVAVPTAIYSMLSVTGVFDAAWLDTVQDAMDEMIADVQACVPSPHRDRAIETLNRAKRPDAARMFGFVNLAMFRSHVDGLTKDGVITVREADDLEMRLLTIMKGGSAF